MDKLHSRKASLNDTCFTWQNSKIQALKDGKLKKHKGYDRPIVPVAIDMIPIPSQNASTVFVKHRYPHESS